MKRGSRILLFLVIVVVILGGVAFLLLRPGGGLFGPPTPTSAPMTTIVTAKQPINRGDKISLDALGTMQFPQSNVTARMVIDPKTIEGKYAAYPLAQGLPITLDMISDSPGANQPGSEAARIISPGLVAITIRTGRLNSMAYGIRDGDHVNVIVTTLFIDVDPTFQSSLPNLTAQVTGVGFIPDALPILTASITGAGGKQGRAESDPTLNQALYLLPSEEQRPRLVSQMILQDIQVLHVGNFALPGAAEQPAKVPEGQPTPTPAPQPVPDVVTLIVSPQDAVALTYLMNSGSIFNLTLRAPDDTTRVETEAATLQYLLSQFAIPVPAKLPYAMEPRLSLVPTPTPKP